MIKRKPLEGKEISFFKERERGGGGCVMLFTFEVHTKSDDPYLKGLHYRLDKLHLMPWY